MRKFSICWVLLVWSSLLNSAIAQQNDPIAEKATALPGRWLHRLQSHISGLNQQLTKQTERYLEQMARQEKRLGRKLAGVDSTTARRLFSSSAGQYAALARQVRADTGAPGRSFSGVYKPYLDSLQGAVGFLKQNPQWLKAAANNDARLQAIGFQMQTLQARMNNAAAVNSFFQQRQQQIGRYITGQTNLGHVLGSRYTAIQKQAYYYGQTLRRYADCWNSPDKLEQQALSLLNRTAVFQSFMKEHSMLGNLFHVPAGYGSTRALAGLQTKDQVAQQVQGKLTAGGTAGVAALQSSLQSAQSALDAY